MKQIKDKAIPPDSGKLLFTQNGAFLQLIMWTKECRWNCCEKLKKHEHMTIWRGGRGNIENTLRWNQVRKGGFRREKRSVGGRGRHLKQITFVLETLRTLEVKETKIGILFTSLKIKPCPVTDQMLACPSDSFPSLKVSLAINSFNESARERFKQLVFIPAPHQWWSFLPFWSN